jgi:hypothetical protein
MYEFVRKLKLSNMEMLKKLFAVTTICLLFVAVSSFDNGQKIERPEPSLVQSTNDTFPEIVIDLSNVMNQLGDALQNVSIELKKMDINKLQKDVEIAFKGIDINKIFGEINTALNEVDTKKIARELTDKMNNIEMEQLKKEMNKAMDQLKKVDIEKIQKALGTIKIEIDPKQQEEFKKSMEKIKPQLDKKMEELKLELEKLKKEVKRTKNDNYTNLKGLEYDHTMLLVTPAI